MKGMMVAAFLAVGTAASASPIKPKAATAPLASPQRGPADAKHVIVEYTDFGCPYCAKGAKTIDALREKYGDDLRIVFKAVPLKIATYAEARIASQYFLAAWLQSPEKAWRLHDLMFDNQASLGEKSFYVKAANALDLDYSRMKDDAEGEAVRKRLAADLDEFKTLGFSGVPIFVIGQATITGAKPIEEFTAALGPSDSSSAQKDGDKGEAAHPWYEAAPSKSEPKETK